MGVRSWARDSGARFFAVDSVVMWDRLEAQSGQPSSLGTPTATFKVKIRQAHVEEIDVVRDAVDAHAGMVDAARLRLLFARGRIAPGAMWPYECHSP